ncbi:MAG: 4-hydroxyphenylpyruvate dioxygenase [Gammaproteobacteria bacterium]
MEQAQEFANPMGTDGFEFLEFATREPEVLAKKFVAMGFALVAKHRNKPIALYRQGEINFVINNNMQSEFVATFVDKHGTGPCAMGFRVTDAHAAFKRALELGARPYEEEGEVTDELDIPAIYGIGEDTLIYFVDRYDDQSIYDQEFDFVNSATLKPYGAGLTYLDHVTHNVYRGNMDKWAEFYERLFNFREIRYFDIEGQLTGLVSRAMTSPCGKIRIPINESADDKSQIEEFLQQYHGEGIQHIALGTNDIYETVEKLKAQQTQFMDVPDSYYDTIAKRVPWHQEDITRLKQNRILIDGAPTSEGGLLLQIFTENVMGPVFCEIIQRKGNEGFGEGNFQALFESIERDQIKRGVLA